MKGPLRRAFRILPSSARAMGGTVLEPTVPTGPPRIVVGRMRGVLTRVWLVLTKGLPKDEGEPEQRTKNISDQLVRLVQVFFGVVAGQGLVLYRDVVTSPLRHEHIVATLALFSIYVMIVWSWIDWNSSMEDHPYDFRTRAQNRVGRWQTRAERWRFYCDIAIVVFYSYMLFQVWPVRAMPDGDMRYLLLGYPLVYALYFVSGELRILRYGELASNLRPILEFLAAFVCLLVSYILLWRTLMSAFWLICLALGTAICLTRLYRLRRQRYGVARRERLAHG